MGIDDPSAREHYSAINAQCWLDYEKGQITQEEVKVRRFREYLALYGVDAKPEEVTERYADALAEQCILLDGALDVLKAVSTKMPIALVTNGIGRVQRRRLEKGNLWGYFQAVIISQEVGAQKPEPQMVFAALKALAALRPRMRFCAATASPAIFSQPIARAWTPVGTIRAIKPSLRI